MDSTTDPPKLILLPRKPRRVDQTGEKPTTTPYGGYDPQMFLRDKLDKYKCPICSKVFKDPHITSCCGKHYCESCLEYVGATVCPNCGAIGDEAFKHFCDQNWKRKISSFEVYCLSKDDGCEWVGELSKLTKHNDKLCEYRKVPCDYCLAMIFFKDHDKHVKEECIKRVVRCKHCNQKGSYRWIALEHNLVCQLAPVPCPNKCGLKMKRKEIEAHNQICEKYPVQCPFAEVGCKEKPQRCVLEKHQASSKDDHLHLAMASFLSEKEKKKNEQKKQRIVEVKMALASEYVESLIPSCTTGQYVQVVLKTLRSMLNEKSYSLRDPEKDKVVLRMDDYQKYQDKEWHSAPFYVYFDPEGDYGYKMCIAILSVKETNTPLISLLLLKGEYDRFLSWPIRRSLKIDNFQGIVVKVENLKFRMEMQQTKKSIAGRQGTLNPFKRDLILDSQQLNVELSKVIDEIHIRDNFESMSFDGALEFSVYMDVPII